MRLPDNYFRELSPADIVSKVGTITLANISLLGEGELERIGWLNNPIIDILYSMTSAGVWVARTDASGQPKVVEANSATINTFAGYSGSRAFMDQKASWSGYSGSSVGTTQSMMHVYRVVDFTSNAGGTLDADVEIVAAKASFYGSFIILAVYSLDAGGATTGTAVFDTASSATWDQVVIALTADYTPNMNFDKIPWTAQDDGEAIVLDTTSSNWGNTKSHRMIVEYWYET